MSISIIITAGDNQPVGACESITIKEKRSENQVTSIALEIPRMRLDRTKLDDLFSRGYFHVMSQIYPLHISILEDKIETVHIHNVWLTGIGVSFSTDEWIVAEGVELEAESIRGKGSVSDQSTSA